MSKPLTIKRAVPQSTDPLPHPEGLETATSTDDLPVSVEAPPAFAPSEASAAETPVEYGKGGVYRSIGGGRRVKK